MGKKIVRPKNLQVKKNCVQIFLLNRFVGLINVGSKKNLGPLKFWVQKFLGQNKFGPKILGQKKFLSKKFWPKDNLGSQIFVWKNFGQRKVLNQKNCRVKNLLL